MTKTLKYAPLGNPKRDYKQDKFIISTFKINGRSSVDLSYEAVERIIKNLKVPKEEREVRFKILCPDFRDYGMKVIDGLEKFAKQRPDFKIADDNREGIRISTNNGFFLLRCSVHDPVMPMNFESNVEGGIEEDIAKIRGFLEQFKELDISNL